ncbi:family 16 glycoside hydrolase [Tautonia marina]|uniref:family 16 glycoside hydrolase n=1 Tax=Tautonia marina TaxID=2653855 RepID=UPI0012612585|nr:family 16 glycoside hydrolase [Tautonia marina]
MSRPFSRPTALLGASAAVVLTLLLGGAGVIPQDEGGFESLFNGKDLSGWEGNPDLWSVEDGLLTGRTSAESPLKSNQFLIHRGEPVRDFELRATFRLMGDNNSGIQYRSRRFPDAGDFVVGGYQADIHPSPAYNGMLYDERGRGIVAQSGQRVVVTADGEKKVEGQTESERPELDLSDWNELTIIARGNKLVHKLNGKTVAEITDNQEAERELEGILALQVHAGPPMTVQFKDIQLRRFENTETAAAPARKKARRKVQTPPPGQQATDADLLKVADGFKVELLHSVPAETQGSWVSMAVDPEGRLIVSDQYGKLFRVTVPPIDEAGDVVVEPIDVNIGEAQGLLWAFDSLYVMVNRGGQYESGFYRVQDTNGDGDLDTVKQLRPLQGGGEHGPHAIIPSPEGDALFVVCGNGTQLTDFQATRVPPIWGEDHLLPRMPDGNGFMANVLGPGGAIYKVDPEGETWELISVGYRNPYDIAFNRQGELFTYDADMEWDINTPWYRPTRVNHAVSGSDYGWRNGTGKWPSYYLDSLPAAVDIGPGSPTGIAFGYGAKFPQKYQNALYICDWSYGKLYAVHLEPDGSSYTGTAEEFITGTPLALTDLVINPRDGAMYFAVGGRRTTSGLYRVTYDGDESTAPAAVADDSGTELRALRRQLEGFLGQQDPAAIDLAWENLGHEDRFVRFAARAALEFQNAGAWSERALAEENPRAATNALLALVRVSAPDPFHRRPTDPPVDMLLKQRIQNALDRVAQSWDELSYTEKLDLLRVYSVFFNRMGPPDDRTRAELIARFDAVYPSSGVELNTDLGRLLVYLQSPTAAAKTVALLEAAPTQEEQIDYAMMLRKLQPGWTPELRERYFRWFLKAANYRGGSSFANFVRNIKNEAVEALTEDERVALQPIIEAQPEPAEIAAVQRPFVKEWTLEELTGLIEDGLGGGRDYDRGRRLFAETSCFSCHRYAGEGGAVGPDLTGIAGRFSPRDLLESILVPSKEVSDQYSAVMIATDDGRVVTGRIVNLNADNLMIMTNMLEPNALEGVARSRIEEMQPSPVSMMPEGLLNTLEEDEILDLLAYLLSRGDREAEMFD